MLKFAERYVLGNPEVFSNADAAYILSYSVIMLNTDLHSPQIKNRMTIDSFIMNNSGIDDGKDLPREFLEKFMMKFKTTRLSYNQNNMLHYWQVIFLFLHPVNQ